MTYETQQIWIKKGHKMYGYCQSSCQNAKNMYNTTNFYIRQVFTAFKSEKPLQPLQEEVLNEIKTNLDGMNENQLLAYKRKLEKENKKPKEERKEIKANLFQLPTKEKPFLSYGFLDALFKRTGQADYRSLPTQSSQWIMKSAFEDWKNFFKSLRDYKKHPHKYNGRPNIPGYSKASQKELLLTNQDCTIKQDRYLKFPKTKTKLNIGKLGYNGKKLKQVRIIPKYNHYVIEVVFQGEEKDLLEDNGRYMGIDLGVNNLATIITNTGMTPVLYKGKRVKSDNHFYNKKRAHYVGILRRGQNEKTGLFSSARLERLHRKRFLKLKDQFHKVSHGIIRIALEEDVNTIVIGENLGWKQSVKTGKRNNQAFCHIPHTLLIQMIRYKAERLGITVKLTEESYTSKASFLDGDDLPLYKEGETHAFSGKRVKRGLYRTKNDILLNADVNGACNILKKVVPDAFKGLDGIEGLFVSTPWVLSVR
ncbi:IS200/IS605 family element transposase accessory protein TnpB (plasmid) [Pontibacillus sp. ALD_SL1]|uniref:RNA-guided endonuclease InsQ/TnpB family protein n=1 Tax=Pontibacillus sp. ALD_SL1 TaxID=2777185 RepID=UPI001A9718B5|nr:RNA-guided endonuclease TnpB family protein [Pontibacillus sp. ALD_SL1]QST02066.1 IS200/IS605 family element transposase accessory protein TnpB [Pontibacillus sp. ALD_SL1]